MNINSINLLIDAIVRQTVVLIAQLATVGGKRAPLAHVANQVLLGLIQELEDNQGLPQKVMSDMFGMALRTYQRNRRRLMESSTDRGRSLWEAIYSFIQEKGEVARPKIMNRFRRDDAQIVRSILNDLVNTGLIIQSGYSYESTYRVATAEEEATEATAEPLEMAASVLWIAVYRNSPTTRQELIQLTSVEEEVLEEALECLLADERIERRKLDGEEVFSCSNYLIPYGSEAGWAGAVFDHYQAMVGAICAKLQQIGATSQRQDIIGGSTFNFDLWEGHPLEEEVIGLLGEFRERAHKLRERVDAVNEAEASYDGPPSKRSILYMGQNVIVEEPAGEET